MPAFPKFHRSPPDVRQIRPGMTANSRQLRRLEEDCLKAGLKMTGLRRVLLHGILRAGVDATAVGIQKTLMAMLEGPVPSQGSIQRNLNLLVEQKVLHRELGHDRSWHYRVTSQRRTGPAITFVDATTGQQTPCDAPEIVCLLRRIASERGLAVQGASITVAPAVLP